MSGSSIKAKQSQSTRRRTPLKQAFTSAGLYGAIFGACALAVGLAVSFGRAALGGEPASVNSGMNILQSAIIFGAGAATSAFAMKLPKKTTFSRSKNKSNKLSVVGFKVPDVKNKI
jgi:hypothetical protein